jgi:polyhydroxyalkanoate synthesis regulator phasin
MFLDDLRKTMEAVVGTLSPANAQKLAKDLSEPGAAKEQVGKLAADLLEWSNHNRERVRAFIGNEVQRQMTIMGVASRSEVDALKKRVRDLEREAGMTASGRKKTAARKKTTRRATAAKKSGARASTTKKPTAPSVASPETPADAS